MATVEMVLGSHRKIHLAIAACLNSTYLYDPSFFENPENIRVILLGELEDWFRLSPNESSQFDQEKVIAYVKGESIPDLVLLLDLMGKNPYSHDTHPCVIGEGGKAVSKWENFVEAKG